MIVFPDKAIDVVDEAGARQRLLPSQKKKKLYLKFDVEKIVLQLLGCLKKLCLLQTRYL
ncbi:MAG: hypothetical protein Ct9H300mP20_08510 [Gammaproteobacteria bacterium]|nr:MAG: hypothetical protein Ct9H300mP20_08510 [Gammaproteobacteria bacterium]